MCVARAGRLHKGAVELVRAMHEAGVGVRRTATHGAARTRCCGRVRLVVFGAGSQARICIQLRASARLMAAVFLAMPSLASRVDA